MRDEVDMRKGVYRRVYSGARLGRRINAVGVDAELLFWRLHMIADDFGNARADADLVRSEAAPRRREWDDERVGQLLQELADGRLIAVYEDDGERYLHILGFLKLQPANRSGRRLRRRPAWPGETRELAEAAGGTAGNPGEPMRPRARAIPIPRPRTLPPPGTGPTEGPKA